MAVPRNWLLVAALLASIQCSSGGTAQHATAQWGARGRVPRLSPTTSQLRRGGGRALLAPGDAIPEGEQGSISLPGPFVSTGLDHACGVTADGAALLCWGGANEYGQRDAPALGSGQTWAAVAAGMLHTCALDSDGGLRCWGGAFGNASRVPAAPDGTFWAALASGGPQTCALDSCGGMACFQGDGGKELAAAPTPANGSTWAAVAVGSQTACAIDSAARLACWELTAGGNAFGQADVPTGSASESWTAVAVGYDHSCAIRKTGGGLECWGDNSVGQLAAPAPPEGKAWVAVAAGTQSSCAISSAGTLACWGDVGGGQGDVPALPGGAAWVGVATAVGFACGIGSDAQMRCWGGAGGNQTLTPSPAGGWALALGRYAPTCQRPPPPPYLGNGTAPAPHTAPAPPAAPASLSAGAVAGITLGAVALLLLPVLAALHMRRRRIRAQEHLTKEIIRSLRMPPLDSSSARVSTLDGNADRRLWGRQIANFIAALWPLALDDLVPIPGEDGKTKPLGKGAFGEVWRVGWNGNARQCALKKFSINKNNPQQYQHMMSNFDKEAHVMAQLRCVNVVEFFSMLHDPPCILLEYCHNGPLHKLLEAARADDQKAAALTWKRRLRYAAEAAMGVLYLHNRTPRMIHGDIKTANLLISNQDVMKVCDFNLSKMMLSDGTFSLVTYEDGYRANPKYTAPEVLNTNLPTLESDAYSFGVVLWELAVWETPWAGRRPEVVELQVTAPDGERLQIPADLKGGVFPQFEKYKALLDKCLSFDPSKRPTFEEIVNTLSRLEAQCAGEQGPAPNGVQPPVAIEIQDPWWRRWCGGGSGTRAFVYQ